MQRGLLSLVSLVCPTMGVLQARTQLETTRAQALDLGMQRAQCAHAMAILLGKPPAAGVADTMIKVFDYLAIRIRRRRGDRPAPHPSPVEAA